MNRKALIIGNNTGYSAPTFLKGVTKDMFNYQDYLKSDIGGRWIPGDELTFLQNKTRREIISAVKKCYADYSFIVFSGHGCVYSKNNITYVCASDGYVSEDELDSRSLRQSLILDCCRELGDLSESFIGDTGESFEKGGADSYFWRENYCEREKKI